MLDPAVHKTFTKDLKKAGLNPTNTAKLFLYISLLLEEKILVRRKKANEIEAVKRNGILLTFCKIPISKVHFIQIERSIY